MRTTACVVYFYSLMICFVDLLHNLEQMFHRGANQIDAPSQEFCEHKMCSILFVSAVELDILQQPRSLHQVQSTLKSILDFEQNA